MKTLYWIFMSFIFSFFKKLEKKEGVYYFGQDFQQCTPSHSSSILLFFASLGTSNRWRQRLNQGNFSRKRAWCGYYLYSFFIINAGLKHQINKQINKFFTMDASDKSIKRQQNKQLCLTYPSCNSNHVRELMSTENSFLITAILLSQ